MTHERTEKAGKTGGRNREKWIKFRVTEDELGAVRAAAARAGRNVSQYASRLVLGEALGKTHKADGEVVEMIEKFQRLFADSMRLSLRGELTAQRFEALVEKVRAQG